MDYAEPPHAHGTIHSGMGYTVLGAGVAKALLDKAVLPDAQPLVTGSIGLVGTKPSA